MSYGRRGLVLAALVSALVALAAAGTARADVVPPPSLAGEVLSAGPNSDVGEGIFGVDVACNADESGSFTFTASGIASGPYPGTFVESGTVAVAPATGLVEGAVLTFHADFSIINDFGVATVRGSKDLVADVGDVGSCYSDAFAYDAVFSTRSSYSATIDTDSGSYRDIGYAHTSGEGADNTGFFALALAGPREGAFSTFTETFDVSNGVVPVGTPGKVTGGGWIQGATMENRATFGFEAQNNISRGIHATCTLVDHASKTKIRCLGADTLVVTGTHATFTGTAAVDGVTTTYRIDVDDLGEPGRLDTFRIVTGTGYSASGLLLGGDIQIHTA